MMALSRQPPLACSLRIFASLSPGILRPIIFSRTSTTLYSYRDVTSMMLLGGLQKRSRTLPGLSFPYG